MRISDWSSDVCSSDLAAHRPHLVLPKPAGCVEREPQNVAVAERPHLRGDATLAGEGVVRGYRAVGVQAHDLAQVRLHVLRRRHLLALAGADPQLAETVEGDAVAVVRATADLGRLPPDHLQVGQAATVARKST